MEFTLESIKTKEKISKLGRMADEIWHEYFTAILSMNQINYMVEKFQSVTAITRQIEEGYQYFFLCVDDDFIGYMGIKPEEETLFLSKLYVKKEYRGKGYASRAFGQLEEICKARKLLSIWLTVNRFNQSTIKIYEKKGFETIKTQITDIGNGFIMDDYIMEKQVRKTP